MLYNRNMTWKTAAPLLIVEYAMMSLNLTLLILPSTISDELHTAIMIPYYILAEISFILMVLHLVFALKSRKRLKKNHLTQSLIFQILMLPIIIFGFVIAIAFLFTGAALTATIMYMFIGLPAILIALLIWFYQILLVVISAIYPALIIWAKRKDENPIILLLGAIFEFFFFAQIIDTICLLVLFKKEEPEIEMR